jgi:hypothetical protein
VLISKTASSNDRLASLRPTNTSVSLALEDRRRGGDINKTQQLNRKKVALFEIFFRNVPVVQQLNRTFRVNPKLHSPLRHHFISGHSINSRERQQRPQSRLSPSQLALISCANAAKVGSEPLIEIAASCRNNRFSQ